MPQLDQYRIRAIVNILRQGVLSMPNKRRQRLPLWPKNAPFMPTAAANAAGRPKLTTMTEASGQLAIVVKE